MFNWLRQKPASENPSTGAASPHVPGQGRDNAAGPIETRTGRVTFDNGERTWEETFDCVTSLVATIQRRQERSLHVDGDRVLDEGTGLWLRPVLIDIQPIHNRGVRTCTKIYVEHPTAIPNSVFEFQHSSGGNMIESIEAGFDSWSQTDLVALSDATRDTLADCTSMILEFPAEGDRPALKRRVIFGPVAHFQQQPVEQEDHPFCPCCLITNSMNAFKELFETDQVFAVRLFAIRGPDGIAVDCRVNGEDFNAGKETLKQYVSAWREAGMEFRKQYVIIQNNRQPKPI